MFQKIFAVYYITRVLLFREKESHFGPFPSTVQFVYDRETGHTQPVTWFDYFRQIINQPYEIDNDLWVVKPRRMEVWTCPLCLSMWVSLVIFVLTRTLSPLKILATAGMSSLLNYLADRMTE